MPMNWDEAARAKVSELLDVTIRLNIQLTIPQLFAGVLATSDFKVDYKALAEYMGGGELALALVC